MGEQPRKVKSGPGGDFPIPIHRIAKKRTSVCRYAALADMHAPSATANHNCVAHPATVGMGNADEIKPSTSLGDQLHRAGI